MTGPLTLSEEERIEAIETLRYVIEAISETWPLKASKLAGVRALLSRDQAPEFCECGGGIEPPVISDGVKLCGHCSRRIKETTK